LTPNSDQPLPQHSTSGESPPLLTINYWASSPRGIIIQVKWPGSYGYYEWYLMHHPGRLHPWSVSSLVNIMDQPSTFIDRDEALQHIVSETQTAIGAQNPLLALAPRLATG
jgi:hypothetical protein